MCCLRKSLIMRDFFPPSQLPMTEAVANYASYKNSNYCWMLGRFVVPVARLEEFADEAKVFFKRDGKVWKLSVLASEDIYETVRRIKDFNTSYAPYAVCDALEVKANTSELIKEIAAAIPSPLETYFEIPNDENLSDLVSTLAEQRTTSQDSYRRRNRRHFSER